MAEAITATDKASRAPETNGAAQNPFAPAFKEAPVKHAGTLGQRFWDVLQSVAGEHYNVFRGFCYIAADFFSPASKRVGAYIGNRVEANWAQDNPFKYHLEQSPGFANASMPAMPAHYEEKSFLGTKTFAPPTSGTGADGKKYVGFYEQKAAEINGYTDLSPWQKFRSHFKNVPDLSNSMDSAAEYRYAKRNYYLDRGKLLISQIEGVVFALLSTVYLIGEVKKIRSHMSEAVGAELGKEADKVTLWDIFSSKNPFIVSEKNRLVIQTVSRYGSDATFFFGIKWGLLGAAVQTTIERTRLNRDRAPYDVLQKLTDKIERRDGQMTDSAREAFVDEMMDVIQMVRAEQRLPVIPRDALKALRPVYDHVVRALASGELKPQGALYFLGNCLDEYQPEQSMHNLHVLIEHGLEGVTKSKKGMLDLSQPVKKQETADAATDVTYSDGRENAIKRILEQKKAEREIAPVSLLDRALATASAANAR